MRLSLITMMPPPIMPGLLAVLTQNLLMTLKTVLHHKLSNGIKSVRLCLQQIYLQVMSLAQQFRSINKRRSYHGQLLKLITQMTPIIKQVTVINSQDITQKYMTAARVMTQVHATIHKQVKHAKHGGILHQQLVRLQHHTLLQL